MKKIRILILILFSLLLVSCGRKTAVIQKDYVCHRSTLSENRQLYDVSSYAADNIMSVYYATCTDNKSTIFQQQSGDESTETELFSVEGEVYQIAATADSVWVLTVSVDPVAATSGGVDIYGYTLGRYDLSGTLLYETEALSGMMQSVDDYAIVTMQPDDKGNIVRVRQWLWDLLPWGRNRRSIHL